jgi:DNA gyrase subunit A
MLKTRFGEIVPIDIEDEMKRSYIDYAMSTIVSRALPDVRDGLKPVHRRCMFAMYELGVFHNRAHIKSARVVGDVMGKFHPHTDSAIYDTIARLAQNFRMRYTLVDGQGNFGSVDGDMPAAMRYTEVRMSKLAEELLADIEKDTVNYVPNYDNSLKEPTVMPARFPNFLVNGSSGIAVGMATNVPPHNLTEVCDALTHLVDNPEATVKELMMFVKGPDFPTGGFIMGRQGIRDAYETGRGTITMRARAYIEPVAKSGRDAIIITEIPYQVNKATLVEHIADLVKEKKLECISDIRDESDREGMRIYIELKRGENAQVALNKLFKLTRLTENFGVIMLALTGGEPKEMTLKQVLEAYIEHRRQVIIRRTIFEVEKARAEAHILEGLKIALENIDLVVKIIRESRNFEEASSALQKKLTLSEKQAKAILDMRLARLTGLERDKIISDLKDIKQLIEYLDGILASEAEVRRIIKEDLNEIKEKFGDKRRSEILDSSEEMCEEDFIVDEEVVVSVTHRGYIKRTPVSVYRSQLRGGRGIMAMTTKEEDFVETMFTATNHDIVLIFTSGGKAYSLKVYEIPEYSRTAQGMAIVNLIGITGGDRTASLCRIKEFEETKDVIFATARGKVKRTTLSEFVNAKKGGVIAISIIEGDKLIAANIIEKADEHITLFSKLGKCIRFKADEIRTMGRNTQGVGGMHLREKDELVAMICIMENSSILTVTENGYAKRTKEDEFRLQHRAGSGIIAHRVGGKIGTVVRALEIKDDDELIVITSEGILLRTQISGISSIGRATQGVRLIRLAKGQVVSSIAKVVEPNERSVEENGSSELKLPDEEDSK